MAKEAARRKAEEDVLLARQTQFETERGLRQRPAPPREEEVPASSAALQSQNPAAGSAAGPINPTERWKKLSKTARLMPNVPKITQSPEAVKKRSVSKRLSRQGVTAPTASLDAKLNFKNSNSTRTVVPRVPDRWRKLSATIRVTEIPRTTVAGQRDPNNLARLFIETIAPAPLSNSKSPSTRGKGAQPSTEVAAARAAAEASKRKREEIAAKEKAIAAKRLESLQSPAPSQPSEDRPVAATPSQPLVRRDGAALLRGPTRPSAARATEQKAIKLTASTTEGRGSTAGHLVSGNREGAPSASPRPQTPAGSGTPAGVSAGISLTRSSPLPTPPGSITVRRLMGGVSPRVSGTRSVSLPPGKRLGNSSPGVGKRPASGTRLVSAQAGASGRGLGVDKTPARGKRLEDPSGPTTAETLAPKWPVKGKRLGGEGSSLAASGVIRRGVPSGSSGPENWDESSVVNRHTVTVVRDRSGLTQRVQRVETIGRQSGTFVRPRQDREKWRRMSKTIRMDPQIKPRDDTRRAAQ